MATRPHKILQTVSRPRRGIPDSYKDRVFKALAPTWAMLKMSDAEYDQAYGEHLAKLDAREIFEQLGENAVLLCWEGFNVKCHRRMVAEWLEDELGIEIPELEHERSESLPYNQMPTKQQAKARREGRVEAKPEPVRAFQAMTGQRNLF